MQVTLMNQNVELLLLKGRYDSGGIPMFTCDEVVQQYDTELLPYIFKNQEIDIDLVNRFLQKRSFNQNRQLAKNKTKILWEGNNKFPYPPYLSLSDQYWLRTDPSQKWEDINFFDNSFDLTLGDYVFCKQKENFKNPKISFLTPDLALNGVLEKRWVCENGKQYLIKSRNKDYEQEPLNEIMATKVLQQLKRKIDFVPYEFCVEGYEICSKCENFIHKDEEFVPAFHIFKSIPKDSKDGYYDHLIKCIEYYNIPNGQQALDDMLIADKILFNYDRHLGNFGYIRNVKTKRIVRPAPLFDFGNAFLPPSVLPKAKNQIFEDRQKEILANTELPKIDYKCLVADIFSYPYLNEKRKFELREKLYTTHKERNSQEIFTSR